MALKPCRECGVNVSTAAEVCPHCGLKRPAKGSASPGCLFVLVSLFVITTVFGLAIGLAPGPSPEQKAKSEAEDEARKASFAADYKTLSAAGAVAVVSGDAAKFEISGWNHSLDLYLQNRLELKAAALADFYCRQQMNLKSSGWKVRVYLVDGTVGAQCQIY